MTDTTTTDPTTTDNTGPDQDQGILFGTWDDPISRFLYREATEQWIKALRVGSAGLTVDLGGGNGLLRPHFDDLVTVDIDPYKRPDVVADIVTWTPDTSMPVRRAILRFVLHYLDDDTVMDLLYHVGTYTHALFVVQFTNDDIKAKQDNSRHEPPRWFRSREHLVDLIDRAGWSVDRMWEESYHVTPDFYRNRLGPGDYTSHDEALTALALTPAPTW